MLAPVELVDASATHVVCAVGETNELVAPGALDRDVSIYGIKLLETGNFRLLEVFPQHSCSVQLGVGQPVCRRRPQILAAGVPQVPHQDGQCAEVEVAGVARASAGCAGLVEMAQIHGSTRWDGTGMERRLGSGVLRSEGRAACRLSADLSASLVRGEASANSRVGK